MRTATFSDAALAAEINARFACVWVNKRPSETFPFFRQITPREMKSFSSGTGAPNITSVFATPEGRVLNAFPGYLDSLKFREEMGLAEQVHRYGFEDYAGLHRGRTGAYLPPKTLPTDPRTSSVGARAHLKLAESGFLRLEDITDLFFAELAPSLQCLQQRK